MTESYKPTGNVKAEEADAFIKSDDPAKYLDVVATAFQHDGGFEATMRIDLDSHKYFQLYADEKGVGITETLRRAAEALRREESKSCAR